MKYRLTSGKSINCGVYLFKTMHNGLISRGTPIAQNVTDNVSGNVTTQKVNVQSV
jgi:hypothetical protein